MPRTASLFVTLLAAWNPAPCDTPPAAAPPKAGVQNAADPYAELVRAFAAAELEYGRQLQAARAAGKDGSELRHPACDFYPRFEALVAAGDGHALLWLASHVALARPAQTKDESRAAAWALYERVVSEHAQARWLGDFAKTTSALYVEYGAARVDPLVDRAVASFQDREVVAELLFRAAAEARRAKNDARAQALTERLRKDFADTQFGRRAAEAALVAETGAKGIGLERGQLAPDFTTTDASGVEFRLSDYRGKVVVVDFWGFW